MALCTDPIFGEQPFAISAGDLHAALRAVSGMVTGGQLHYFGFTGLSPSCKEEYGLREESLRVDNFFLLHQYHPAGSLPAVLTVGLDGSRFVPVLYWEIFHALASGGNWIEVAAKEPAAAALCAVPMLSREYYRSSMECLREIEIGSLVVRLYRKLAVPSPGVDDGEPGWSFGILTAGPSPVARRMIADLLRLCPEQVEVIVCGPLPDGLPDDPRIRHIDLERPETRGWITRKKNLLVDTARYQKVCILHDRIVVPEEFFSAMERYGENFSVVTFPQVYYPDVSRTFMLRYPDYQVLLEAERYFKAGALKLFNSDHIFHLKYGDYYPSAFCCGGLYVTKKAVWNLVRQDESLFHCEWEDVVFGLECLEKGIPHRVNPYALVESLTPHPMLLLGMHVLTPGGKRLRGMPQLSDNHRLMAVRRPEGFKPVLGVSAAQYRDKVQGKLAGTPLEGCPLPPAPALPSRIWSVLYLAALKTPLNARGQVFRLYQLMAETVFNFPNCVLQVWCRDTERELLAVRQGGVTIRLASLLFRLGVRVALSLGRVRLLRVLRRLAGGKVVTLYPMLEQIEQFLLVQRAYPRIFAEAPPCEGGRVPLSEGELEALRHSFRDSVIGQTTIFCEHQGEQLPPFHP